ncbi:MAG: hypothetical protein A2X53_12675 [Candidatus Rokubacteria bacterium GWA2_70_23]|nr:MAG: hypothetical protein A2X53_12675 [Candidatus Rokubacteria bacterium GWA2_70_23]
MAHVTTTGGVRIDSIASNPNVSGRLTLDPRAREDVFAMYRMLAPIGYASALQALLQMDSITERLPEIAVPMRIMAETITHAERVLLSPACHFANRDQPEAFNPAVLELLAGLGA